MMIGRRMFSLYAAPLVGNGALVLTAHDDDRLVIAAPSTWHGSRRNLEEVTIEVEASPAVATERYLPLRPTGISAAEHAGV